MFRQVCITALLLTAFWHQVDSAMKKSWKSAVNFDSEIPKFTPFEDNESFGEKIHDEVQMKTTQTPLSPSPTAETLSGKISSKIRAPSKQVAEMYNQFMKEQQNKDFGVFNANLAAQAGQAANEDRFESIAEENLDIEQIVNQLNNEVTMKDTEDNSLESTDDFEVSSISNNENTNTTQFKVGPLMNVTLDPEDSLVNVNLDQNTLKQIFTGRGKKNGLLERVVPLFILPFLIQSAVVPFMVTMIKLFLMKSLFAGKIAVLLLILGALKNHQNGIYMKSMHSPYYLKDFPQYPERRIEQNFDSLKLNNFEGYKADGKTAFIN